LTQAFGTLPNGIYVRVISNFEAKFHPTATMKSVLNRLIPFYVSGIKSLEFDVSKGVIVPVLSGEQDVKLANWEMDIRQGFIFTLQPNAEFVPKVNINDNNFTCQYSAGEVEEHLENGSTIRRYIVRIELAGVTKENITISGIFRCNSANY
jgi:hypothetical protein